MARFCDACRWGAVVKCRGQGCSVANGNRRWWLERPFENYVL